jgi:hypothetical protein
LYVPGANTDIVKAAQLLLGGSGKGKGKGKGKDKGKQQKRSWSGKFA